MNMYKHGAHTQIYICFYVYITLLHFMLSKAWNTGFENCAATSIFQAQSISFSCDCCVSCFSGSSEICPCCDAFVWIPMSFRCWRLEWAPSSRTMAVQELPTAYNQHMSPNHTKSTLRGIGGDCIFGILIFQYSYGWSRGLSDTACAYQQLHVLAKNSWSVQDGVARYGTIARTTEADHAAKSLQSVVERLESSTEWRNGGFT